MTRSGQGLVKLDSVIDIFSPTWEWRGEAGFFSMRIKAVICNCKGLCPSFKNSDMNTLPFDIESDLDVDYAIVHPQLCGMGGNRVMEDILRSAEDDPDTFVIVGACDQEAQLRLFQKLFCKTGFGLDHYLAMDIRGATNEGILERLRERIEERVQPREKRHWPPRLGDRFGSSSC